MNDRKKRYLSHRAAVFVLATALTSLLTLALQLYTVCSGGSTVWTFALDLLLLFTLFVIGWWKIIRPYRKLENEILLFLEGHDHTEISSNSISLMLSPASECMLLQAITILNPSQLFHLNKRQAQYLALQNQINPHFLYNTLESIRSEALIAQLDSVADMTEALALFFRYTISKAENLVSVEEELQNCETYFRIQQYRFGDRLCLQIKCDPEDREDILRCRLPKLTMQPILENSIIHGTEQKLGTGHLTIGLELTDKRLLICISDDGVGIDEMTLSRLNGHLGRRSSSLPGQESESGGLALVNVDNRIRLLFGEEYGLHVFSLPGSGTDVEITLPAITSDREIKNREALQ